ncbi:MAG: flavin reductase family protein [Promethearchaeota archaeon]
MRKKEIGARNFLYPMPTTLVGANVKNKPNYEAIAYCGIVNSKPPMISIASARSHYTNIGINENKTFSVNIPSEEMVEATDYCGIVSGSRADKSAIFETFYGRLKTAPMIMECPINLECKLVVNLFFGGLDEIFIGEIVEAYAEETYLTKDLPDIEKIKPIIYSVYDDRYWRIGEYLGQAFSIGKEFKPKKQ